MEVEDENGRSPGPGLKMLEPFLEILGGSVTSWRWLPVDEDGPLSCRIGAECLISEVVLVVDVDPVKEKIDVSK